MNNTVWVLSSVRDGHVYNDAVWRELPSIETLLKFFLEEYNYQEETFVTLEEFIYNVGLEEAKDQLQIISIMEDYYDMEYSLKEINVI